jgi:hypothetical protein
MRYKELHVRFGEYHDFVGLVKELDRIWLRQRFRATRWDASSQPAALHVLALLLRGATCVDFACHSGVSFIGARRLWRLLRQSTSQTPVQSGGFASAAHFWVPASATDAAAGLAAGPADV